MEKILILYLPVIHKGYLDFIKSENPSAILVLQKEIVSEFIKIERHLRTLDEVDAIKSIQPFFPSIRINVFNQADISNLSDLMIVMPDEDVSHEFANKYLKNNKVIYKNVFLRYDKKITQQEFEIPPHRIISEEVFHKEVITKVTELTKKSDDWWRQIAALIVKDGEVLLEAFNRHLPSTRTLDVLGDPRSNFDAGEAPGVYTSIHAEAHLIAQAANKGISLNGSDVYATTFPCPNCARLLVESGIKRVFYDKGYSLLDAEQIFNHYGVEIVKVKSENKN